MTIRIRNSPWAVAPPEFLRRRFRDPWAIFAGGMLVLIGGLFLSAAAAVLWQSLPVWRHTGWDFILSAEWFYRQELFGAAAMIYGSAAVSAIALLVAVPLGVLAAVCLSEYLPARLRWSVKLLVESLAAVPSVVYGLLGVLVLREWVGVTFEPFGAWTGDTLLTAGLLLALMVLPLVVTISDDALQAAGVDRREAARGLGLTRAESVLHAALPHAWPGIVAAALLALGRALGETIAVFLVVGRMDNQLPERIFSGTSLVEPGQTLTSKLGGPETHLAMGDTLHWGAIMGLCAVLFAMTSLCVLAARALQTRWRAGK